jgi:hypothetical protein
MFFTSFTKNKHMKLSILFASILIICSTVCNAQSFFKADPLGVQRHKAGPMRMSLSLSPQVSATDSIFNAFRPIANIAAYGEPGNFLLAGVGGGYQHLDYNYVSQTYTCKWSVNIIAWAGGSVAPSTPSSIASIGATLGLDNNLIEIGPAYNIGTKSFFATISVGINFNNL